jgi:hypothetical protein
MTEGDPSYFLFKLGARVGSATPDVVRLASLKDVCNVFRKPARTNKNWIIDPIRGIMSLAVADH